jgi:hypothetical protein
MEEARKRPTDKILVRNPYGKRSRLISRRRWEANIKMHLRKHWAWLVLGWVTAGEHHVPLAFHSERVGA